MEDRSVHCVDCYLKALRNWVFPFPIPAMLDKWSMTNSPEVNRGTRWLGIIWMTKPLSEFIPAEAAPANVGKAEYLAELSDMLQGDGLKTIFFGGPAEIGIVEKVVALAKIKPVVLTGKLNLLELAAAIKKCSVFLSGDSGPMHIAVSQQVPVVALFGPTSVVRYGPYNCPHVVIQPAQNIFS